MTKSATNALEAVYRDNGITSPRITKALNALNEEAGLTDPHCVLVKNLYSKPWENIPPNGFGVVKASRMAKRLKRVSLKKKEEVAHGK